MSKGRNPTKRKWRNGQRQKGSHITYIYVKTPTEWKSTKTWYYYSLGFITADVEDTIDLTIGLKVL